MKSEIIFQIPYPFLGVKYSPCHTKALVCSNNSKIYTFDVNSDNVIKKEPTCIVTEPEGSLYDFAWYPFVKPSVKESFIFLSTGSGIPIHLWDANNGCLKASYCGVNKNTGEHMSAISLSFNTYGNHIVSNRILYLYY